MIYIDQIHVEGNGLYSSITGLKYSEELTSLGKQECTKQEMVNHLRENPNTVKTKYKGLGDTWYEGETVYLADNTYLRTDSPEGIGDSLEHLIKY